MDIFFVRSGLMAVDGNIRLGFVGDFWSSRAFKGINSNSYYLGFDYLHAYSSNNNTRLDAYALRCLVR